MNLESDDKPETGLDDICKSTLAEMLAKKCARTAILSLQHVTFDLILNKLEEQISALENGFDASLFDKIHFETFQEADSIRSKIQREEWEGYSNIDSRIRQYAKRVDDVLCAQVKSKTKALDDLAIKIDKARNPEAKDRFFDSFQEHALHYPFDNPYWPSSYPKTKAAIDKYYMFFRAALLMTPYEKHYHAKKRFGESFMYSKKEFTLFLDSYVREISEPAESLKNNMKIYNRLHIPGYKRRLVNLLLPAEFKDMIRSIKIVRRNITKYNRLKSRLVYLKDELSNLVELVNQHIANPDTLKQDIATHEKELDSLSECKDLIYTSGIYASCTQLLGCLYHRIN